MQKVVDSYEGTGKTKFFTELFHRASNRSKESTALCTALKNALSGNGSNEQKATAVAQVLATTPCKNGESRLNTLLQKEGLLDKDNKSTMPSTMRVEAEKVQSSQRATLS